MSSVQCQNEGCGRFFFPTAKFGPTPRYCPKCREVRKRAQTARRVANFRSNAKEADGHKILKARPKIIHIVAVDLGRTLCGAPAASGEFSEWMETHKAAPRRACKKCATIWDRLFELAGEAR